MNTTCRTILLRLAGQAGIYQLYNALNYEALKFLANSYSVSKGI